MHGPTRAHNAYGGKSVVRARAWPRGCGKHAGTPLAHCPHRVTADSDHCTVSVDLYKCFRRELQRVGQYSGAPGASEAITVFGTPPESLVLGRLANLLLSLLLSRRRIVRLGRRRVVLGEGVLMTGVALKVFEILGVFSG